MRKNVLILGHSYATQFVDVFNQYARLFDKNKYSVTIAYLTGDANDDVRLRTLADEVVFLNASKRSIRGLKLEPINQLFDLCKEKNFEQVICHRYKPSYIMMWVSKFHRIPAMIFVMHELNTMTAWGRRLLIAALQRENMMFAGVSNAVRDDLRHRLWRVPHERIITLYNMIDVELTEPQLLSRESARQAFNLSEDTFVFGNLARLVPNKDHASLIEAFARIKPTCPNAKLMIMGNGLLEAELKAKVKAAGLQQDIIFTGYVSGGFQFMKAFDCFVLSSTQEAFGRVLLEAMIAKCPIIATKTNGIPEVVGDTGMIVPPKNVAELAEAMRAMYSLSAFDRMRIADHAYTRMQTQFSIPVFQQQYWQLPLIQSLKD